MHREGPDVMRPLEVAVPWSAPWDEEAVIRLLEPMVLDERRKRLATVFDRRIGNVTVLMDAPHDPHNGAALLRSCDAFGVQVVHVVPREEEFLISRTVAAGTERWVDVVQYASVAASVSALESRGFELCATHPDGELVPEDLAHIPRVCLVFGNEHDGISRELRESATKTVRVPMRGFVESLNVSVSAALLLRAATRDRDGDLSPAERRVLYARGLFHTVPRAAEILAGSRP
jgi:tRNA (guanosine-2'-O-)-methyltransferase